MVGHSTDNTTPEDFNCTAFLEDEDPTPIPITTIYADVEPKAFLDAEAERLGLKAGYTVIKIYDDGSGDLKKVESPN